MTVGRGRRVREKNGGKEGKKEMGGGCGFG